MIRSRKDKKSSYAPRRRYRYDGIYRIEKCWQVAGQQVNRYVKYFGDLVKCFPTHIIYIFLDRF